jgi:hypothetical protein
VPMSHYSKNNSNNTSVLKSNHGTFPQVSPRDSLHPNEAQELLEFTYYEQNKQKKAASNPRSKPTPTQDLPQTDSQGAHLYNVLTKLISKFVLS